MGKDTQGGHLLSFRQAALVRTVTSSPGNLGNNTVLMTRLIAVDSLGSLPFANDARNNLGPVSMLNKTLFLSVPRCPNFRLCILPKASHIADEVALGSGT